MGSFFGHALPGSFFIIIACWWCVQIYKRFYRSLRAGRREDAFVSTVTWPVRMRKGWVDIEAYVVFTAALIGILVEVVAAPIKNHKLYTGNIQHATMYFFFGMTSLCAITLHRIKVIANPDSLTYVSLFMAYTAEGLLFKFHLFGRPSVDVQLHTLLVYTIFATSLVTLFEIKYRHNVLLPLARAFFTFLQGTWFWQAAFILYPPFSDPWGDHHPSHMDHDETGHADHNRLMFVTCVYTWHAAMIFILMLITGIVMGKYYQRHGGIEQVAMRSSENLTSNGYSVLNTEADDMQ